MNESKKTIEVRVERTISAAAVEVFDGWLNPKIPGNPWNTADKLILNPVVDGFFYWTFKETPHYGRFVEMERANRIQHTWMSPSTSGLESMVTVTFKQQREDTVMTLVHSGLPDTDGGRGHDKGWDYFLGCFTEQFRKPRDSRINAGAISPANVAM